MSALGKEGKIGTAGNDDTPNLGFICPQGYFVQTESNLCFWKVRLTWMEMPMVIRGLSSWQSRNPAQMRLIPDLNCLDRWDKTI